MPHGTHEISSKGNGEGKSAQGSPPLPFLLYVQEPSPTEPLRPGKHSERHKMRCRLHRTDKREAHYKDGKAAVRSLPGCCPPYGSIYVHLMQRAASVIAAQCIGHRSALHCASQRSAFVPQPWCRIRRIGMLEDVRLARLHPSNGRQVRPMLLLFSKSRPYPRDRNASPFARKPFLPVKRRPRYWGEINFNPARRPS